MDRASKLVVLGSMAAALFIAAALAAPGWPPLLAVTIATFAAACAVSVRYDEASAAAVLACAFVYPAAFVLGRGPRFDVGYTLVWLAGLLGTVTPAALTTPWRLHSRWKAALVLWALTVAFLWPIVVL